MTRLLAACSLLFIVLLASTPSAQAPAAIPSDQLVDSVGVNVHLHHTDTLYGNFDLVQWFLGELGVRHVRDGLIDTTWQGYYDRHNALGARGIKGLFIAPPAAPDALLRSYPSRMASSFEAYELPNELDASGSPAWTTTLLQSMLEFRALALDADAPAPHFPVIAPALTTAGSFEALGDVSAFHDYANLHNYFSGRNPGNPGWGDNGYGSIDWNLALANLYAPGKPVITTETGYWDDPALVDSIPAVIAGRYMPRLVLEQLRKGISRTYIYELIDFPVPGLAHMSGYGLVRADGSWKPSFFALRNLLRLFADPGPAPAPRTLDYTVLCGDPNLRQMLFERRDGTFLLALWLEHPAFNMHARTEMYVRPEPVQISVPTAPVLRTYQWLDGGNVAESAALAGQTNVTVPVGDSLLVIQLAGRP